jgi:hypothetical protein
MLDKNKKTMVVPKRKHTYCTHCNKPFSCGCQKTKATDGQIVHKTCRGEYEHNKLRTK